MLRSFVCVAAAICLFATVAPAQVKINEVFTGTPDHVELYNCGATAADVSGWTLRTYYATVAGAPVPETPFTFPGAAGSGTTVIPAGGFLIVEEFGVAGAPGTLPNSIAVGFNYFWVNARTFEVALVNDTGLGIDYVYRDFFGNGTAPNLPAGTNWTGNLTTGTNDDVARNKDSDTDDASDWSDVPGVASTAALNVAPQVTPGQVGGCGSATPVYETNDAAASFDVDGVMSSGFSPAVTNSFVCVTSIITLASNVPMTVYEVVYNGAALVPAGAFGSVTTANGQHINVDLTAPGTAFLIGGVGPAFGAYPGTFSLPISHPMPLTLGAQAAIGNPGHADGFSMSQAIEYVRLANPGPVAGPTTDDGTVLVNLTCGPVSFLGTQYSSIGVNANGRVTMGGIDGDFSPSIIEAQTDLPFIGYWHDFNPATGGSINITETTSTVSVNWVGVPFFGEAATANTFSIVFNRTTGTSSITGLTGIGMNPANGISTSDSIFLGISPGNSVGSATNAAGSATFTLGAGPGQVAATDMVFDFLDSTTLTTAVPFTSSSLAGGTLNQIDFATVAGLTGSTGF